MGGMFSSVGADGMKEAARGMEALAAAAHAMANAAAGPITAAAVEAAEKIHLGLAKLAQPTVHFDEASRRVANDAIKAFNGFAASMEASAGTIAEITKEVVVTIDHVSQTWIGVALTLVVIVVIAFPSWLKHLRGGGNPENDPLPARFRTDLVIMLSCSVVGLGVAVAYLPHMWWFPCATVVGLLATMLHEPLHRRLKQYAFPIGIACIATFSVASVVWLVVMASHWAAFVVASSKAAAAIEVLRMHAKPLCVSGTSWCLQADDEGSLRISKGKAVVAEFSARNDVLRVYQNPGSLDKPSFFAVNEDGRHGLWPTKPPACYVHTVSGGDWLDASCPNGHTLIAGGCDASDKPYHVRQAAAVSPTTFRCGGHGGPKTAFLTCCDLTAWH